MRFWVLLTPERAQELRPVFKQNQGARHHGMVRKTQRNHQVQLRLAGNPVVNGKASLPASGLAAHAASVGITLQHNLPQPSEILDGYQYTCAHETLGVFRDGNLLNSSTSVVTITYTDVLGTLGVLNVNDVCAKVVILGPAVPCQQFALSFTDLTLGNLSVVAAVGTNVNIAGNVATINFDGSIAAASATIDATGGAGNSPVPEPGTMSLMATGLIGAAGAIRRRLAINS